MSHEYRIRQLRAAIRLPQGMKIKCKQQFLVDYPGTILEGICGSVFAVFRYADHTDMGQGRFNAFLDGNNSLYFVPFFIHFLLYHMDGIVLPVHHLVLKLGGMLLP